MLIIIAFASECNIRSPNGCCAPVYKWLHSYDDTYIIILPTRIISHCFVRATRAHVVYNSASQTGQLLYANGEKDNEDIKPIFRYTPSIVRGI
jgi:hypothetical protein